MLICFVFHELGIVCLCVCVCVHRFKNLKAIEQLVSLLSNMPEEVKSMYM